MAAVDSCPLRFDRVEIDLSDDMEAAFERSVAAPRPYACSRRAFLPKGLRQFLTDASSVRPLDAVPVTRHVVGAEASSGAMMRIMFRGRPRSLDFCARHVLGSAEYVVEPRARANGQHDVVVTDHPLFSAGARGGNSAIIVAPWIGQQVPLADSWHATLAQLPRSMRKELGRALRKRMFTVTVDSDPAAIRHFYERLYLPYVAARFGRGVLGSSESAFRRESRNAVLLALFLEGRMSGGTVLTWSGDRLSTRRSALNPEHDITNRSELLDYCGLLIAQKLNCRWLDLGLSRPHLEDGVFRYKCKWRPRLYVPGGWKSPIRIEPVRRSEATLAFLRRNGFIERRADRFLVRRLSGAPGTPGASVTLPPFAARAGLDALALEPAGSFFAR